MKPLGRWLALLAVVGGGCQQGSGDTPALPRPPTPAPTPPSELRLIPIGFGGPLFQPESVLPVAAGSRLLLPVMSRRGTDFTNRGEFPGISILVKTDAPEAVLTVSPEVVVDGGAKPGLAEVVASEGAPADGEPDTYRIWLEPHPHTVFAEGWGLGLDETPLRLRVVEPQAPPPPCERLDLTGAVAAGPKAGGDRAVLTFGRLAEEFHIVEVAFRASHPEASLTLLSRYEMPYKDLDPESDRARVRFGLYPTTFASALGFRETAHGFDQTMTLGVFDELRLRAEAPGCDPVELYCDGDGFCAVEELRLPGH